MHVMVKNKKNRRNVKAGVTVEAALLCPFLCLILCSMIAFTLKLYQTVDDYAEKQKTRQEQELSSEMLIRLEAMTEELL